MRLLDGLWLGRRHEGLLLPLDGAHTLLSASCPARERRRRLDARVGDPMRAGCGPGAPGCRGARPDALVERRSALESAHTPRHELGARVLVGLRNTGPRKLRIDSASVGALTSAAPVDLPVEGEQPLSLGQQVAYGQEPALGPAGPPLLILAVRTPVGAVHHTQLPLPLDVEQVRAAARDACRWAGPDQSAELTSSEELDGREVRADLTLANDGRRPLVLTRIQAAPGLVVTPDRPLPLRLLGVQTGPTKPEAVAFSVTVRVVDCAALGGPAHPRLGQAVLTFTDVNRTVMQLTRPLSSTIVSPDPIEQLIERICPT